MNQDGGNAVEAIEQVREYLAGVIRDLRTVYARKLLAKRRKGQSVELPCDTCAFRAGTDEMVGFEYTIMGVVAALNEGTPFFCHHDLPHTEDDGWKVPRLEDGRPDYSKIVPCKAWLTMVGDLPLAEDFGPHLLRVEGSQELLADLPEAVRLTFTAMAISRAIDQAERGER